MISAQVIVIKFGVFRLVIFVPALKVMETLRGMNSGKGKF